MRIMASGDNHFDVSHRWEECLRVHDWIATAVERERPDAFLLGGDIYHRASTPLDRAAVADWLKRIAEVCPVVMAKGNHERARDAELLGKLRSRHPILVEERCGVHHVGDAAIAVVAWPDAASVAAMIGVPVSQDATAEVVREALRGVFRGLGADLAAHDGPRILLLHAMIDGALTGTGQPIIGAEMNIPLEDLALARADIVLASHVHRAQEWSVAGTPVVYAGSSYRLDFGETEPKSIVVAEVTRARTTWSRLPTPATPMLLLEADYRDGELVDADTDGVTTVRGAEIRYRYTVDADQRDAARVAAQTVRAALLEAGAVSVKLEDEVRANVRARLPELARARTIAEKVEAWWTSKSLPIDDERRSAVLAKLGEVEAAVGVAHSGYRGGALQLRRLAFQGFGTFEGRVEIDLSRYDGKLVAVTGENGAGKTTLCGLLPGALYREVPTRGSLAELAVARDAFLEADILTDRPLRIRHVVDGSTGKAKAFVFDADGAPAMADKSGLVSRFEKWAATNLPPAEVFFASAFTAQKSRGFLELREGERKAVLLRALGVEALEALAKAARERLATARAELKAAVTRLEDEEKRCPRIDLLEADLAAAESDVRIAEAALAASREELDAARAALASWEAAAAAYEERRARRNDLVKRFGEADARCTELARRCADGDALIGRADEIRGAATRLEALGAEEAAASASAARHDDAVRTSTARIAECAVREREAKARAEAARARVRAAADDLRARLARLAADQKADEEKVSNNRALLERAETIRAAVDRLAELDTALGAIPAEVAQHEAARADATRRHAEAKRAIADAGTRKRSAIARIDAATRRLGDRTAIETAIARLPALREEAAAAIAAHTARAEAQERIASETLHGAEDRIKGLRGGLDRVIEAPNLPEAHACAIDALASDNAAVVLVEGHPARLAAARVAARDAAAAAESARRVLAAAEVLAARASEIAAAEAEITAAARDRDAATSDEARATDDALVADGDAARAAHLRDQAQGRGAALQAERAKVASEARWSEKVAAAQSRIADLEAAIARRREDVIALEGELAAIPADGGSEAQMADIAAAFEVTAAADARLAAHRAETGAIVERALLAALAAERSRLAPIAADAPALARAEAIALDLAEQLARATETKDALAGELAAFAEPSTLSAPPDIESLSGAVCVRDFTLRAAQGVAATARVRLDDARSRGAVLDGLRSAQADAERTVSDWALLAEGLGPDGVQALEIDNSAGALSEMTNDLLHTCHGPRFTVTIDTQRSSADGKRTLEGLAVRVLDTEKDREGEGATFSGGECTIVDEAISLALTMLGCQRAGMRRPTLVRDETSSALSPRNCEAYVGMLRRAAHMLESSAVLFVSHSPDMIALADAEIRVADGKVSTGVASAPASGASLGASSGASEAA